MGGRRAAFQEETGGDEGTRTRRFMRDISKGDSGTNSQQ